MAYKMCTSLDYPPKMHTFFCAGVHTKNTFNYLYGFLRMICLDFFPYSDRNDAKGQSPSFRMFVHDILYIYVLFFLINTFSTKSFVFSF